MCVCIVLYVLDLWEGDEFDAMRCDAILILGVKIEVDIEVEIYHHLVLNKAKSK